MAKIDFEKFVCSLADREIVGINIASAVSDALAEQGIAFYDGKLIETSQEKVAEPIPSREYNVGDWVVFEEKTMRIEKIEDRWVDLVGTDGMCCMTGIDTFRLNAVDWNIDYAKIGDTLVCNDGSIFLYRGIRDCLEGDGALYYCVLTNEGSFETSQIAPDAKTGFAWAYVKDVHPATKKQHDCLFNAMKEAGYEWDAEKRDLTKAESWIPQSGDIFRKKGTTYPTYTLGTPLDYNRFSFMQNMENGAAGGSLYEWDLIENYELVERHGKNILNYDLTEFETKVKEFLLENNWMITDSEQLNKKTKQKAKELLDIAREEILKETHKF